MGRNPYNNNIPITLATQGRFPSRRQTYRGLRGILLDPEGTAVLDLFYFFPSYPYGCSRARTSATTALILAVFVFGGAFCYDPLLEFIGLERCGYFEG